VAELTPREAVVDQTLTPDAAVGRRRRPRAVSFVASLLLIESILVSLVGLLVFVAEIASITPPSAANDAFGPIVDILPGLGLALTVVVAGGGLLLASAGLFWMREWGWVLAMAFQGFGLANSLYAYFHEQPQFITMAVTSLVVLVLNQREVRQAFDLQSRYG
jgi:hypothetical protein